MVAHGRPTEATAVFSRPRCLRLFPPCNRPSTRRARGLWRHSQLCQRGQAGGNGAAQSVALSSPVPVDSSDARVDIVLGVRQVRSVPTRYGVQSTAAAHPTDSARGIVERDASWSTGSPRIGARCGRRRASRHRRMQRPRSRSRQQERKIMRVQIEELTAPSRWS